MEKVWLVCTFDNNGKDMRIDSIYRNQKDALEKKKNYNQYGTMCEVYAYDLL